MVWYIEKKECVGVNIVLKDMEHIPIHEGILPSCFVHDKRAPKCTNYPDHLCDMHKVFSGGPGNMRIIQTLTMDSPHIHKYQ